MMALAGFRLKLLRRFLCCALILLPACQLWMPDLPPAQPGMALLVLGFTTELVEPYDGGTLYSGFSALELDGITLSPALGKGQFQVLAPGAHQLGGECYWRLRGTMNFADDLREWGQLEFVAAAGHVYTIASSIDEYKMRCQLSVMATPWH